MFVYLSKLLPQFIYPVGLITILILVALLAARRQRLQRFALMLCLLLLLVAGNPWVSDTLTRSLEWRYLPVSDLPQADVIVLLGGGTQPAEYPRQTVEVGGAGDRVLYAARLYQQGKAQHILLTGGRVDWSTARTSPAEDMAVLLKSLGVPPDALWMETTSRNTYENAVNSRGILEDKAIRRIILVTSAAHMPRSVGLFERQGFEVIPAPVDFTVTEAGWQQSRSVSIPVLLLNLIPSAENLSQTTGALKEYVGIFIYRLRGWL